ncbi:hypothetical protein HO173_006283 [Letharia columbiana]|uniref:Nephrocystin 3-like N-terminal domain-containing protein n=1 Tax=Letharia columbiana TaxID=112416 RepID=A0A8H6FVK8_9LECA|nr:uncharacterized protein HO173_006283 [Letharia columbiana]KAF6235600.1 hypothetical protein HO173_006283 [Letharia columbiana]
MADPLSVSASIAGLITVTDAVLSRTSKYVKAVQSAPNEVSSLTLALGALSGILHNLRLVASQLEGEPFDTAIQVNHTYSCIETMEKVEYFFYYDYKTPTTQDLRNILGSLACQLAVQDDQSFGKLQAFYAKHNRPDRPSVGFDLRVLHDLLVEMASSFDDAMVVVDALDECRTQTTCITSLLSGLNDSGEAGNTKTLFLSRSEREICEVLENYDQVSVAAIECRTRNKELRIKDQSLKQNIMERLVEGADGIVIKSA